MSDDSPRMAMVTLELDIPESVKSEDVTRSVARWLSASGVEVRESRLVELTGVEQTRSDMVAGLELSDSIPDGWTPLEALVAVRCLPSEPDGGPPTRIHWSPTSGLPSWEAAGMCDYMKHQIGLCWGAWLLASGDDDETTD